MVYCAHGRTCGFTHGAGVGSVRDTFESVTPRPASARHVRHRRRARGRGRGAAGAGAAEWWGGSLRRPAAALLAWKSHLTRYMGRLAKLVHDETGKPLDDATLEIVNTILHLDWAAKHALSVLRPRRVASASR